MRIRQVCFVNISCVPPCAVNWNSYIVIRRRVGAHQDWTGHDVGLQVRLPACAVIIPFAAIFFLTTLISEY